MSQNAAYITFDTVRMMKRGQFLNVNSEVPVQKSQTEAISYQDMHCSHLNEA